MIESARHVSLDRPGVGNKADNWRIDEPTQACVSALADPGEGCIRSAGATITPEASAAASTGDATAAASPAVDPASTAVMTPTMAATVLSICHPPPHSPSIATLSPGETLAR